MEDLLHSATTSEEYMERYIADNKAKYGDYSDDEEDWETRREDHCTRVVCSLSYPDYATAESWIDNCDRQLAAEYGEIQHGLMKAAHEATSTVVTGNPVPKIKEVFRSAGERIGSLGGMQAMVGVYYSHLAVLETAMCIAKQDGTVEQLTNEEESLGMTNVKHFISSAWDGLHGWEH